MKAMAPQRGGAAGWPRQRLIGPFPPPTGGVAVAAHTVARALEGAGARVERFDTSAHAQREDIYRARGVGAALRNLGLLARLAGWVLAPGARDGVYHLFVTSDRAFVRDRVFLDLLRLAGCRVIVHLHSKTKGEYFVEPTRLRAFGRDLARGHRVVVLSESHREFFAQYVAAEKLRVLENFVIAADLVANPAAPADRMLYLSRISEMKGTWELVRAVALLAGTRPDLQFSVTIAGTADTPRTQADLEAFVAEAGISARVRFVGHVEGPAKTALFREHGVFLFPSRFENSPITLKEATQAGLAIVASDIVANRNVVDRCGNAVFHVPGEALSLADRLAGLLDDPGLYGRLRAAAASCAKYDESYALPILRALVAGLG
jgi:glycosyltransferase involved in cell wall biosynthesis